MSANPSGYVYILFDAKHKLIKIGCTKNGNQSRQKVITGAHPSLLINVLNARVQDRFAAEAQCHTHFKHQRTSGEWFSTKVTDAITYINENVDWCELDFECLSVVKSAITLAQMEKHHQKLFFKFK